MQASYRLNANELDENFLESLKMLFQDKEIEILVYDVDGTDYLSQSDANRPRLLTAIKNVEQGNNLIEIKLEDLG